MGAGESAGVTCCWVAGVVFGACVAGEHGRGGRGGDVGVGVGGVEEPSRTAAGPSQRRAGC